MNFTDVQLNRQNVEQIQKAMELKEICLGFDNL